MGTQISRTKFKLIAKMGHPTLPSLSTSFLQLNKNTAKQEILILLKKQMVHTATKPFLQMDSVLN